MGPFGHAGILLRIEVPAEHGSGGWRTGPDRLVNRPLLPPLESHRLPVLG